LILYQSINVVPIPTIRIRPNNAVLYSEFGRILQENVFGTPLLVRLKK